jgi:hypothetical protein
MSRVHSSTILLAAIAVAAALLLIGWWVTRRPPEYWIEYVIPNDYRGVITFEEDSERGAEPANKDRNTYVYTVNETGTLVVRSFALFEHYHHEIARYADGRAIPTGTSGAKGPKPNVDDPAEIELYDLGWRAGGGRSVQLICVGTLDDYRKYRRQYGFE